MSEELTVKQYLFSVLTALASAASQGCAYVKSWPPEFHRKEINKVWEGHLIGSGRRVTIDQLRSLEKSTLLSLGFRIWDGSHIVIPLWAWNYIADGEKLICIDGEVVVKGDPELDLDVRAGCVAYGFIYSSII